MLLSINWNEIGRLTNERDVEENGGSNWPQSPGHEVTTITIREIRSDVARLLHPVVPL